ncbi:DUF1634 domain-containing protein [Mucilaginibacter pedocola]|uniref:DUF1634 domain-containing protein n=1 Tax=Mucilaginibacter pedocola TaxID=1792845 RepID=A0A1S9PBB2_9SPHI|nr:DUF1634 domain-containing protein [Mucilaginibacter pedocola]OOQ58201.1 hypothetical protein BC343_11180 [Mucilaginibacter pedocola]
MNNKEMQSIIGWILRAGVFISMAIVFVGGVLYILRHGQEHADYHTFKGIPAFINSPEGIIHGILEFRGQAIIQAGIILLIATPVIRIVFSAFGFVLERDYLYVGITLIVLLIILSSMLGGHAG